MSRSIGVCIKCIRKHGRGALEESREAHKRARRSFSLPVEPPKTQGGIQCKFCANECVMGEGERGYCGLRGNENGRLVSMVDSKNGLYYSYLDPHVTNCCAAWFCPAGTGMGYPTYSCKQGPEIGFYNLAIFFYGCNFNCLFCQNYSHKALRSAPSGTVDDLVETTLRNPRITCWCFFGGSPEPQLPFAINASRRVIEALTEDRVLRVCFEWNGCGNRLLVKRAAEMVHVTGGNIKFDLKCWDENLSLALSGQSNRRAYENFAAIAKEYSKQPGHPPVVCATTLLVPGYVDELEVGNIAEFIASIDPEIPYSLLVYHPDFAMRDLPMTPRRQVEACYSAAKRVLESVNIGNVHLLAGECGLERTE